VFKLTFLLLNVLSIGYALCQDITFEDAGKGGSLKRGKTYQMYLKSTNDPVVSVQLIKNNVVVKEGPAILVEGKYVVYIPVDLNPGAYSIAILNSTHRKLFQVDQVHIKQKIPLWAKIGVCLVAISSLFLIAST
jgi:hypothetical protein